ncbi:hypothetical protein Xen7305DRAFT_00044440 [Xenococcus sp. PCC 7305]|nr:hypothetical protein Xen7305DRAFT_00044440 [Xenococcus sp. PCC 7305]
MENSKFTIQELPRIFYMGKLCQEDSSRLSSNFIYPQNSTIKNHRRKSLMYWVKKPFRLMIVSLKKLRGHPEVVARGIAVGVFAGCFPFFGLQSVMGIVLASLVRGSKIAAIAGTWISNPLTYVPILFLNFKVGQWLLGIETTSTLQDRDSLESFLALGPELVITLLIGCCVVGAITGVIGYFASFYFLRRLRKSKKNIADRVN